MSKTNLKHIKNESTRTLYLFYAKNCSKKHLIFEKRDCFDYWPKWPQCKGNSLCKIITLGQKKNCLKHIKNESTSILHLFYAKKLLELTPISKFLAQDNDFPAFWLVRFPKPIIWAIIVKFDQIRRNWWRISCAEILEVGKNCFAASSVKKMSRFEEVSPEEIKKIAWKFTKTVILLGLAEYELIITNLAYGLVGYTYQLISGASSKNNC